MLSFRLVVVFETERPSGEDGATVQQERDLYRSLLELGSQNALEPFIRGALALLTELCGARKGYIMLSDDGEGVPGTVWSTARGCSPEEVEEINKAISRGIIGAALASGQSVVTASATTDIRFRERGSVRRNGIEAVLCVPIGADPPAGVVYLQDRAEPGPFVASQVQRVESFARYIAAFAERLIARQRSQRLTDHTKEHRAKLRTEGFIGHGRSIAETLKQVTLVAPLDVSVLFTGQSGTGKNQLARIVHENSPRAPAPFVELNCAALPDGLLESELFGALQGSHSTAARRVRGKLEAAEGGTLFLDEVGELSLSSQAKLLQFLQSKQYYPLGSTQMQYANVRVLAATNAQLREAVLAKRFREDLLYRLEVIPIRVPSLTERKEDIADLVLFFCEKACAAHQLGSLSVSKSALRAAELAEWPGNVRQLAHSVQAAAIRSAGEGALEIAAEHLFPGTTNQSEPVNATLQSATRIFQRRFVLDALERSDWNIAEAAESLDIARSYLYALIRALGIKRRERIDTPQRPRLTDE